MITLAQTDDDLRGILALQRANSVRNVPPDRQREQGFVTLQYTLEQMRQMNALGPSVIAKDGDTVVGYAITAMPQTRQFIPELASLFNQIDELTYNGQPIRELPYYVMGQVCVADGYRGQGLFDRMYQHHQAVYGGDFQLLITDISARNTRSIRAHERVGFRSLREFYEPGAGEIWVVVAWDLKKEHTSYHTSGLDPD